MLSTNIRYFMDKAQALGDMNGYSKGHGDGYAKGMAERVSLYEKEIAELRARILILETKLEVKTDVLV